MLLIKKNFFIIVSLCLFFVMPSVAFGATVYSNYGTSGVTQGSMGQSTQAWCQGFPVPSDNDYNITGLRLWGGSSGNGLQINFCVSDTIITDEANIATGTCAGYVEYTWISSSQNNFINFTQPVEVQASTTAYICYNVPSGTTANVYKRNDANIVLYVDGSASTFNSPNVDLNTTIYGDIIIAPFCGDDNCDIDETCATCPADCGECEATTTPVSMQEFGEIPTANEINLITSYTEIYTYSTSTPSEIRYSYFSVPFFLFLYILSLIIVSLFILYLAFRKFYKK